MDLNATRMFVAVVQAGSLSAAATRLGIPLPTLSRRIRDLERQLKVQLLERSARGTKLTDAGARLYEHASRGIEALLEAEQAVVSDQARLKGRLRLSLPQTFEPWWDLLAAFQRRYPDIQVYVYSTERRVDLIEDGIDVALRVGAIVHESHGGATCSVLSQHSRRQSKVGGALRHAGRARRTSSLPVRGVGVAHRCPGPMGIGRAGGRAQGGAVHQRLSSLVQPCARWRRGDGAAALPGGRAPSGRSAWCHCCRSTRCPSGPSICSIRPTATNPPSSGHIWTSARAISRKSFRPAKSELSPDRIVDVRAAGGAAASN